MAQLADKHQKLGAQRPLVWSGARRSNTGAFCVVTSANAYPNRLPRKMGPGLSGGVFLSRRYGLRSRVAPAVESESTVFPVGLATR
jgi:hypothetical protein